MKIKVNEKENTIVLTPEYAIDYFHLGKVFGGGNINYTMDMSEGKINWVSADVVDLWIYIFKSMEK